MQYALNVSYGINNLWNDTPELRAYIDGGFYFGTIPPGHTAQQADEAASKVGRFVIVDCVRDESMGGYAELFTVQFNFFTPELSPVNMAEFLALFAEKFYSDVDWTTEVEMFDPTRRFIRAEMLPGWAVRPGDTETGNEGYAAMAFLVG